MQEVLNAKVSEGFIVLCGMGLGLVAIVGTILVTIIAVLAYNRRQAIADEMAATLKIEMIQRGMSADEIERVLHAKLDAPPLKALARLIGSFRAGSGCQVRGQQANPT